MKKVISMQKRVLACLCVVFALLVGWLFQPSLTPQTASAYGAGFRVDKYDVQATVQENREIVFTEKITITFLQSGNEIYRSFPLENDQYSNIWAKCDENPAFDYNVAANPDVSGFFDVNLRGDITKGKTWTYEIGYTLLVAASDGEYDMILDVIGYGWPVALNDVTVKVDFPDRITAHKVRSGVYGSSGENGDVVSSVSADGKSIIMTCARLDLAYNDVYEEYTNEGITLAFSLPSGTLRSPFEASFFTQTMWLYVLLGVLGVAAALLVLLKFRTKREIVTVVHVKPPQGMDPLTMGKLIDGAADAEDVTSMVYYFASKGYLIINLEDKDDPVLIRKVVSLPDGESTHAKTLFDGLFKKGDLVKVSELKYNYYESVEKAKALTSAKSVARYDKKSIVGCVVCLLISAVLAGVVPLLAGMIKLNGFADISALAAAIAPLLTAGLLFLRKERWYKLKSAGKAGLLFAAVAVSAIGLVVGAFAVATAAMTTWEKVVICAFALVCSAIGVETLSRSERLTDTLGDILGFKDFIVYTEQDKIKFMLQDNPELMYDILPYAQVLGVSDEWEQKFKGLTLKPPSWCVYSDVTVFDYILFNHYMRTSLRVMSMPPPSEGGKVGRSGGGGFFGGFAGGGHGGGGGGMR